LKKKNGSSFFTKALIYRDIFTRKMQRQTFFPILTEIFLFLAIPISFIMDYGTLCLIVNPDSVGQPRDGKPDASFAVLDTITRDVKLKRTNYDVEKVIRDMLNAHLPEVLAYRLRAGC
jgi:hypothetical protein